MRIHIQRIANPEVYVALVERVAEPLTWIVSSSRPQYTATANTRLRGYSES